MLDVEKQKQSPARPRLMSVPEVAAALSLSESYTRRLIARGELPKVGICRRTLIDARDVEALIERFKGASRDN